MGAFAWLRRSRRPSSPPESLSSAGRHSDTSRPASSSDRFASSAALRLRRGLRPVLASALLCLPLLAGLTGGAQAQTTNPITMSVASSSGNEGNSGSTDIDVTVAVPASTAPGITYELCFSGTATRDENGTKTASEDYQVINPGSGTPQVAWGSGGRAGCVGLVSFAAGANTTQVWKIRVFGDTAQEQDETIVVTLREDSGSPLPPDVTISTTNNPFTYTVTDDDRPVVTIAPVSQLITEGETATLRVQVSPTQTTDLDVNVDVESVTTNNLASGQAGVRTVTILANGISRSFDIRTVQDNTDDVHELIQATVQADSATGWARRSDPILSWATTTTRW